jgi:hypothetical protein|eukprot:COSAG06_NODE_2472_length_6799_cov_6.088955_4_plen_63_part_00
MYDIFGKYGAIRQIRLGNAAGTKVRTHTTTQHTTCQLPGSSARVCSVRMRQNCTAREGGVCL